MTITMKKADVLKELKSRLESAKAYDKKRLEQHKQDERKALEKFHASCRTALTWDWKKVKAEGYRVRADAPSCPSISFGNIESCLAMVSVTSSDRFSIKTGSDLHHALTWVPPEKRTKDSMCG